MSLTKPVRLLSPEVARKIAAGEVIDRPNAIIRELMDNAIDSGADSITVEITGGGIDKIRVTDNGNGMSEEDLKVVSTPHATSKISTEQDLLNLSTLGFRGEALSSIAAVSKLTITSGEYKLETNITEKNKITPTQPFLGTIVQSENLFQNFPARRLFLKRAASEAKMCFNTFIEKALPFFNIEFRFIQDGQLKLILPKEENLQNRFITANNYSSKKDLFFTLQNKAQDDTWNYSLIIGEPSIFRTDRKEINIFVNNRKITEYSLLQAIEYGCTGFFPNGTHPVASLFVTIDSNLVDFNIHPAKKEVRFKDINALHHSVSSTTLNFYKNYTVKSLKPELDATYYENTFSSQFFENPENSFLQQNSKLNSRLESITQNYNTFNNIAEKNYSTDLRSVFMNSTEKNYASVASVLATEALATSSIVSDSGTEQNQTFSTTVFNSQIESNASQNSTTKIKYFGTALGVFLLVQKGNTLFLIDQHAAHERILYNSILTNKARPQKLLVPYELGTQNTNDDAYLESIKEELEQTGFFLTNNSNGKWQVTQVHERWTGSEKDLQTMLLDQKIAPEKILNHIAASTACKAAVKDGYYLDELTATELAEKALLLPDPHCPHGRPVWTALTKEKLFEMVRRTL